MKVASLCKEDKTQLSMEFIMLINVKMPTIVGILILISMINTLSENLKFKKIFIFQYYSFYEQLIFDLILYVPSTNFKLNRDGSSWVELVLS